MEKLNNENYYLNLEEDVEKTLNDISIFLQDKMVYDLKIINTNKKSSEFLYFIIGTVTSQAHLNGIYKSVLDELDDMNIGFVNGKNTDQGLWYIIDCGYFLIHLMSQEQRNFYEIEKIDKGYIVIDNIRR